MTAAERKRLQRSIQKENDPDNQTKENERIRLLRECQKTKMTLADLKEKRTYDRSRQALYHQKKMQEKAEREELEPVKIKVYNCRQPFEEKSICII